MTALRDWLLENMTLKGFTSTLITWSRGNSFRDARYSRLLSIHQTEAAISRNPSWAKQIKFLRKYSLSKFFADIYQL